MSQAGIASISKSGGGGLIQTILGDTGSITGPIVTIYTGGQSGNTVYFTNSGTVSTLSLSDSNSNTFLGNNAGGNLGSANSHDSTSVGIFSLNQCTSGSYYNSAFGAYALANLTTGRNNTAVGWEAGGGTGMNGTGNTLIGVLAGSNYNGTENSNIILGAHVGTTSVNESNTLRIGNVGVLGVTAVTRAFIQGITGVTVSNAQLVTINSSTGQLGVSSSVVGTGTDITGTTQQLAVGNGYATDNGGGVVYTLPATATFWDQIIIVGKVGITTIKPNANQQIYIGAIGGTVGVTGTAVGTNAGDCITLRCTTGGTSSVWRAETLMGNWTLS